MDVIDLLVGGLGAKAPGLVDVLPEKYQAYRPIVGEGLRFFLEGLPQEWVESAIAEQLRMPPRTRFPARAQAFARHFPTIHKLCQVVARDRRLDLALRRRLQALESVRPTVPMAWVEEALRREVGCSLDVRLGTRPLAEGSVAVVVPFRPGTGGRDRAQEGVFKLLKPGIEERIGRELDLFAPLGALLEQRAADLGLPEPPLAETLAGVARQLRCEVRLDQEQAHLTAARKLYADFPPLVIPALLEPCTPHLTAMERVRGKKVTDAGAERWERRRLAEIAAQALLAKPFWTPEPLALFHGDPHAGNLFRTQDGRLAALDWTLTVEIPKSDREGLTQVVVAGFQRSERRLCRAVAALAEVEPDPAPLREAVRKSLAELSAVSMPSVPWTLRLIDRVARTGRGRFPDRLLLLFKALFALRGVLDDLAGRKVAEEVLVRAGFLQVVREFPLRFVRSPASREFGSHLSTADLLGLVPSWPLEAARFWARAARRLGGNQP